MPKLEDADKIRRKRENTLFQLGDLHPERVKQIIREREKTNTPAITADLEAPLSDYVKSIKPPGK